VSREVLVVVGTRPELVKMAPVVRALDAHESLTPRLLHTGQHYDDALSGDFFATLGLPDPATNLEVGSGSQSDQTAAGLVGIDDELATRDLAAVLAQGDTNAVLSAALATSKRDVPFGHVEAGIRSFDRSMPEEVNRVLADHVADWCFAPTETAAGNLADAGIESGVHVVGNTVVDACLAHREVARRESSVLEALDLVPGEFALATIHRAGNTDDAVRLQAIVEALGGRAFPVVLPAHPRTVTALEHADLRPTGSLRVVDPLSYLDFLRALDAARVVVTDSGGVQEEASVLETPCLTVRPNTERPETVDAGVNELVDPGSLGGRLEAVYHHEYASMTGASTLYGDGDSAARIVEVLASNLDAGTD
jgi:UDP-N-acetylglucosamine 2-epimerase